MSEKNICICVLMDIIRRITLEIRIVRELKCAGFISQRYIISTPYHVISSLARFPVELVFSARCNIYISRLCYDVSVRLSVCDGSELAHYS